MSWGWCRRGAGIYLALFFLAVAAAPHHHINGLEDLLLDQRSDSGIVVQTIGPTGPSGTPELNRFRLVRDVPCLACFTGDFVSVPSSSVVFVPRLERLPLLPVPPRSATPELLAADTSSRSPPRVS